MCPGAGFGVMLGGCSGGEPRRGPGGFTENPFCRTWNGPEVLGGGVEKAVHPGYPRGRRVSRRTPRKQGCDVATFPSTIATHTRESPVEIAHRLPNCPASESGPDRDEAVDPAPIRSPSDTAATCPSQHSRRLDDPSRGRARRWASTSRDSPPAFHGTRPEPGRAASRFSHLATFRRRRSPRTPTERPVFEPESCHASRNGARLIDGHRPCQLHFCLLAIQTNVATRSSGGVAGGTGALRSSSAGGRTAGRLLRFRPLCPLETATRGLPPPNPRSRPPRCRRPGIAPVGLVSSGDVGAADACGPQQFRGHVAFTQWGLAGAARTGGGEDRKPGRSVSAGRSADDFLGDFEATRRLREEIALARPTRPV